MPAERPRRRAPRRVELGVVVAAELDQQRGRARGQLAASSRACRGCCSAAAISAGATISSTARAPGRDEAGTGRDRRVDARRSAARRSSCVAGWRHGLEHGLGDERERALRADEQPAEDLERRVGVEERAQPVAGRVLDLELAPDPLGQLLVGADLVADLQQPGGELGLGRGEALLGARGGACRSPCPTASTKRQLARRSSRSRRSMPQRMPPELLAITPPTLAMSVDAGSGPSL